MNCVGFIASIVWHFQSVSVGSFGVEYQGMGWACVDWVIHLARRSRMGGFRIVVAYTFCLITR